MKNLIDTSGHEILFYFFTFLIIALFVGTWLVTISMAEKRGRSQIVWFILAIFFPIYAMIFLALLGETDEKRKERIMQEEMWRKMIND